MSISNDDLAKIPFELILHHSSRSLYSSFKMPRIHVLEVPLDLLPFQNDMDRYQVQKQNCFNADNLILTALQTKSTNISHAELLIIPYFHGFYTHYRGISYSEQILMIKKLTKFADQSLTAAKSTARLVFILVHDSGGCIALSWIT